MFHSNLIGFMTSGPIVAFELLGENAIARWREFLGPTDSAQARSTAGNSIRAKFGTGGHDCIGTTSRFLIRNTLWHFTMTNTTYCYSVDIFFLVF